MADREKRGQRKKGSGTNSRPRPFGCFALLVPDPFFRRLEGYRQIRFDSVVVFAAFIRRPESGSPALESAPEPSLAQPASVPERLLMFRPLNSPASTRMPPFDE